MGNLRVVYLHIVAFDSNHLRSTTRYQLMTTLLACRASVKYDSVRVICWWLEICLFIMIKSPLLISRPYNI